MSSNGNSEKNGEYNGDQPDRDLPPSVFILILISVFSAGLLTGILLFGAFGTR